MDDARALLETGVRHHGSGDLAEAERLYRRVLETQPENADAHYLLGTLAQQAGDPKAAVASLTRAIKANRRNPYYHLALGDARLAQGKPGQAETSYRKALSIDPGSAEATLGLGNLLHSRGRIAAAIKHYRRAIALKPELAEAHNNLGVALLAEGAAAEAAACFTRALELRPDYPDAHLNLGRVLKGEGKMREAIASYRAALELDPRLAEAHNNLGNALREQGDLEAALTHYRQALAIRPDFAAAHNGLGIALAKGGAFDDAIAAHRRALALRPRQADWHVDLGAALNVLGDVDAAIEHCRTALSIAPDHVRAHQGLAMARRVDTDTGETAGLESLLGKDNLSTTDALSLRFTLGKRYDDAAQFDRAFAHYRIANELKDAELRRRNLGFDAAAYGEHVERLIAVFDQGFFATRGSLGADSELPVFILGMARSGTTLVEQILASHSRVFGAGELEHIGGVTARLPARLETDQGYPGCAVLITPALARRLGQSYIEILRGFAPDAARVTDKLPGNFLHLGVIALLAPRARVIHCRRDPLDTCLSCYFQHFEGRMSHAYDLGNLGRYFRGYARLMAHWRTVLPRPMLEVSYEDLIADQEAVSREIITFCGLEWEEACLRFHDTKRAVRTASLSQVRQPIYGSSVGRWRNYEKHLGPLKAALFED